MKVIHLSTYDNDGGAARAAFRLHESLLGAGQDSSMLVQTRRSKLESVHQVSRAANGALMFGELIQNCYIDRNRTPVSTTWFSLGWPAEDLSCHPLVQQADIIHLHWVSGLVTPHCVQALERLGKPIVWSLHDQRAFTGGCHYTAGCDRFETDCTACPQLNPDSWGVPAINLAEQVRSFATPGITVVAPSRWMAQCARRSAVFAKTRIEVIPYGIDLRRFKDLPQPEARAQLGLPEDEFLLLFGVDNAREKRKGLNELFAALTACARDKSFVRHSKARLLCFGEVQVPPELPIPIRSFGRIRSDGDLSRLYAAADLFLLPSLEDNLPNTVLESMACGTPVGAFRVGGVPDLVRAGKTGFLAEPADVNGLTQIILRCARDVSNLRNMRPACRKHVETNFSYGHHARAFLSLYEDVLSTRQNRNGTAPAKGREFKGAPRAQNSFAPLLQNVFDAHPDVFLSSAAFSSLQTDPARRALFARRVKRTLKHAVNKSWTHSKLITALDAELDMLKTSRPRQTMLKHLLKNLLRIA
jgi:glycosyltransferase involved in cell wall biosynthesis